MPRKNAPNKALQFKCIYSWHDGMVLTLTELTCHNLTEDNMHAGRCREITSRSCMRFADERCVKGSSWGLLTGISHGRIDCILLACYTVSAYARPVLGTLVQGHLDNQHLPYLLPQMSDRKPPRGRAQKFIRPKMAAKLAAFTVE